MSYKLKLLELAAGGSNATLTAANGGVVYSDASKLAILAPTSTGNQPLLSGASGAPGWSTATYPGATTINQLLYSSAANTIGGLATANNGTLVTSSGGVPSILAGPGTTGQILQSNAAAAPSFSTASYPSTAGTSGNVITSNGTNFTSSATTGVGSLVLVATNNPSAALTSDIANIGSYTTYFFTATIAMGTANGRLCMRFSSDNGSTFSTTTYNSGVNYSVTTSATINNINTTGQVYLSDTAANTAADTVNVSGYIYTFGATATQFGGNTTFVNSGLTTWQMGFWGGSWGTVAANALRFFQDGASGTITGKISLYGVVQ